MASPQPAGSGDSGFALSRGAVFPLVGNRSTWKREHLLPVLATIVVALTLMAIFDPAATGEDQTGQAWQMYVALAVYIAFITNYYINQMCGAPKSLWALAVVALLTAMILDTALWDVWYGLFYTVIPGTQLEKSAGVVPRFAGYLLATGLCEEGFKALPLLVLALAGAVLARWSRRFKGRFGRLSAFLNRQLGLRDPRDGIVFGVASGAGFFINETLGEYVPRIMSAAKHAGGQAFDGMVVLLSRGLPDMVEHSAWAGLFGYFIGLAVLRPGRAFLLLPLGWVSAAALHGAWDGFGSLDNGYVVVGAWLAIGLLSYALLAGAIFKAREISPMSERAAAAGAQAEDSDWE